MKNVKCQMSNVKCLLFVAWAGFVLVKYILMLGERGRMW